MFEKFYIWRLDKISRITYPEAAKLVKDLEARKLPHQNRCLQGK